jgi:hypothetical protein
LPAKFFTPPNLLARQHEPPESTNFQARNFDELHRSTESRSKSITQSVLKHKSFFHVPMPKKLNRFYSRLLGTSICDKLVTNISGGFDCAFMQRP